MTVTLELPAEVESTEQAIQECSSQEEGAAWQTMLAGGPVLRRLWDTSEEDEAWKDL